MLSFYFVSASCKRLKAVLAVTLMIASMIASHNAAALDARDYIERGVSLIEQGEYALARSYLAPALIHPRISSGERSRAYYLRGFSFLAQQMYVSARKDFNRALEFNPANPVVLTELARLYAHGQGVEQDQVYAFALFEQAAQLEYPRAQFQVGRAYLNGYGVEKNIVAAREALTEAAQQGHGFAMLNLASSYREQYVADPQPDVALAWYNKAHAQGEPNALLSIAFMHANGELGDPDPATAAAYFQQALNEGAGIAGVHLAYAYLVGDGVPQDYGRAFTLYTDAAAADIVPAYVGLGHMYEHGLGVRRSPETARQWYEKGASQGEEDALMRLVSFHLGRDTDEARAEALRWSEIAARGGSAEAYNTYAWLLATLKTDSLRNGALAVDQATRAVSAQPTPAFLDTLAAAYAELGDFEQAAATQREALTKVPEDELELQDDFRQRLRNYERSEPWRE